MIFAGDIGGTNARFACYADGERCGVAELDTVRFETAEQMLAAALDMLPAGDRSACCLAVAGPVLDGEARLTNAPIAFTRAGVAASTGVARVALVNDLVALGTVVAHSSEGAFELLDGLPADGPKAVVAVGTGLGMAIVSEGRCVASEGGHARVAPVGAFERELLAFTESEAEEHGGIVAWEHYLSGRGVEGLHRAVCAVWGAKPPALEGREVVRLGLTAEDPVCHTTVETLAGMLATACGGLAATGVTLGGVYLAGSVTVAIAEMLRTPLFRRRFNDAAWAAEFLATMPIYLVADPLAGLDGARLIAEALE